MTKEGLARLRNKMGRNHLKRNVANKRWVLLRKEYKFVLRPNAGKHSIRDSVPLGYFLKYLGFANTTREAKKLLLLTDVLIDGRKVKDVKCPVGFMDSIVVGQKAFRCLFGNKGRIIFIEVDDSDKKICKVLNKVKVKGGKTQLNLSDGRNILSEDDVKVGDSLLLELPSQKIVKRLQFKEGASIVLIGGKYGGVVGKLTKILDDHIFFKDEEGAEFSTLKDYAFVVGGENPELKIKIK